MKGKVSKKVCPIMTMSLDTPDECIKEHCALWVTYASACTIKVQAMETMKLNINLQELIRVIQQ
jgi:hypothetical protein